MWFDPKSDKSILKSERRPCATPATPATQTPEKEPSVAKVAEVAGNRAPKLKSDALPELDNVARSPAAVESVWDDTDRAAREFRRYNTPPTCASCGTTDWAVSITEPNGCKMHVLCWKLEKEAVETGTPDQTDDAVSRHNYHPSEERLNVY